MAKYNFTATHGVTFGEHKGDDASKPFEVWAQFEHARELDTPTGEKVYTFGTDDAKVAERLRNVDDYGITEVKSSDSGNVTVDDLKAEIERRNAERAEADQIKPKSPKKADLQAALDADDE